MRVGRWIVGRLSGEGKTFVKNCERGRLKCVVYRR